MVPEEVQDDGGEEGMEYAQLDPNRLIMLVTGDRDDPEDTLPNA